jgi:hypothetical protein
MARASWVYRMMTIRSDASHVGLLFYDRDVEELYRLFGRQNVLILLHEEMVAELPTFAGKMANFIGADPQEFVRLVRDAGQVHSSISTDEAEFISFRARRGLWGRQMTIDRFGAWLFGKLKVRGDAHRTFARIEQDARKIYADSNRRLGGLIDYDLAAYGYPL